MKRLFLPQAEKWRLVAELPRFEIKKLSGDPTNWKSFIKSFNGGHSHERILVGHRTNDFSINHVEGEAESVIKGYYLAMIIT